MNFDVYYRNDLDDPIYLYNEGKNYESYKFLGAHKYEKDGKIGTSFCVWAPHAREVYLMADFNGWDKYNLRMKNINNSGIWNICIDAYFHFDSYKYRIIGPEYQEIEKADPYGFHFEFRPHTSSKVYDLEDFHWTDTRFTNQRMIKNKLESPMSIYELNAGSWMRHPDGNYYSFNDLANTLPDYIKDMGYTHVEFMPLNEFPFDGSWGYQVTGYFGITSRYGTPKDFMHLVNELHKRNIGVILDWVPVHFTRDYHGLSNFDGRATYEHPDPYRNSLDGWGTLYFDLEKPQVRNFLISSALFLLRYFHIDGLRVDAVSAMLYLNYEGKDIRNQYGGYENLVAIDFIKELNSVVHLYHSDVMMIAEESTAYPKITHPIEFGGLGFDFKWNMGWMHDTLDYFEEDPAYRKEIHNNLTFSITYAFSENFILPFSHDEVVHLKKSMLSKMHGSYDDMFRSLMALYAYMYAHPGKKLLFMGSDIGVFDEWNPDIELAWSVLQYDRHQQLKYFVKKLNEVYKKEKPLHEVDDSYDGFEWVQLHNSDENIISFERIDRKGNKVTCIFNFGPVYRHHYRFGVDKPGKYKILINSAHRNFGGPIERNYPIYAQEVEYNYRQYSVEVDLHPYQVLYIKHNN